MIKPADVLKQTFRALGIQKEMNTDPALMQLILKEMRLDDFDPEFEVMRELLSDIKSKPITFHYLLEDIENGLINQNPAVLEFLEVALEKQWLEESDFVIKTLHVTYVLEVMTSAMCNNYNFFLEAHTHLREKEYEEGIDSRYLLKTLKSFWKKANDFFEIAKTFSIDPIMVCFLHKYNHFDQSEIDLKKQLKVKELNYLEYKILSQNSGMLGLMELLRINIYEAWFSEYKKGFAANSIAAHVLSREIKMMTPKPTVISGNIIAQGSKNPFYKKLLKHSKGNNEVWSIPITKDWMSLYETWNFSFILGEVNNLDLVIPKLLIPSISNVESRFYLQPRVISLWLTINNVIFRKYLGQGEIFGTDKRKEMAKAWGKINIKHALKLAKSEIHEDSKELMKSYRKIFSRPVYNLVKLLVHFFR